MKLINNNMKWIMLISGVLTFTMVFAAIAPHEMLNSMFGDDLNGPLAEIIVRNWAALITLVGGMLIYGAYNLDVRKLVLVVAVLSKLTFISLVITYGFAQKVIPAISLDVILVFIFSIYLFSNRKQKKYF